MVLSFLCPGCVFGKEPESGLPGADMMKASADKQNADARKSGTSSSKEDSSSKTAASKNTSVWETLENDAEEAFVAGHTELARELWGKAIKEAQSDKAQELNLATTLNQMNHLYVKTREYEAAHSSLKRALEIRERLLPKDDLELAETMGNLALISHKLHRDGEAEQWYEKSLAIKEKKLDANSPQMAITMHNLANLYSSHKQYAKAKALLEKVLAIDSKNYGEDHIEVVRDLTTLGINSFNHKLYDEAESYLSRALQLCQKNQAESHKDLLNIHHYLGLTYGHSRRHDKAKEHYSKVGELAEKVHGKGHPETTTGLLNIARNADDLGRKDESERLYLDALKTEEERKPSHDLMLTHCYVEVAHFYQRHDQKQKAEEFYRKGLTSYDRLPLHEKRKLYEVPSALARLLDAEGKKSESLEISKRYMYVHTPHSEDHFRM